MKKLITILGLLLYGVAHGQGVFVPFVAAPAAAADVNSYQFYIDSISNVTLQQQSFAAAATNTTTGQVINLTTVPSGVHQLYVKVTNTSGHSSIFAIGNFFKDGGGYTFPAVPTAAADVNRYDFYIDSVGASNEQPQSFSAAPSNSITGQSISMTGVPVGVHQLYAKVTNTNGNSSIFAIGNFYKDGTGYDFNAAPTAAATINRYDFYIDSVTAVSQQTQAFTAAATNTTTGQSINLTTVPSGVHQLYAKVTNTTGNASIFAIGNFYKEGPGYDFPTAPTAAPNVVRYGFYIDSVTAVNEQTVAFTPSTTNTSNGTNVNLAGVLPGVHQLYARVFDASGNQSIVNLGNFNMTQNYLFPAAPSAAPALSNLEYYIDDDPGFGLGTPITVPGNSGNINLTALSVTIPTTLTTGQHTFHIRSKQNPWSIEAAIVFEVDNTLPVRWMYARAELQNSYGVISWSTLNESKTKEYKVQYSLDGITFTDLATVAAVGNTTLQQYYNYTHANLAVGLNYYRIKQIDLDGRFTYSPILKLLRRIDLKKTIVAPNPAHTNTLLVLDKATEDDNTIVKVYSTDGNTISTYKLKKGTQQLTIDVSTWANGNYTVEIIKSNEKEILRLLKQ